MVLQINGRNETLPEEKLTISELLGIKKVPDPGMVSVQLNGEILERVEFTSKVLGDGDELEFLYFMGGGSGRECR